MLAHMIKLLHYYRAMFMTGIGNAPERGDDRVIIMAEITPRQHSCAVNGYRLHNNHACAAAGTFGVIAEMAFSGQPVLGHVGGVGAENYPVFQGFTPNCEWLCQMCEMPVHI